MGGGFLLSMFNQLHHLRPLARGLEVREWRVPGSGATRAASVPTSSQKQGRRSVQGMDDGHTVRIYRDADLPIFPFTGADMRLEVTRCYRIAVAPEEPVMSRQSSFEGRPISNFGWRPKGLG